MIRATASLLACLLAACQQAPAPRSADRFDARAGADARRIEADVRFLADDLLEGREAGTRGHELAALYVAQRLRAMGLQPAGDGGSYYQRVPMLRATRVAGGGQLLVTRDGARTALRFREQFLPALNYNGADMSVSAPAVFVAQGVHAPALGHDDFRGINLHGKIAVLFSGAPAALETDARAFHGSSREKLRELSERGAIGAVFIDTDADEARVPWRRTMQAWDRPGMRLRAEDGGGIDTFPQLRVVAHVSAAAADVLLAGTGRTAAALFKATKEGTLKPFDMPVTISLGARTEIARIDSRNVVARLDGGDAVLSKEHVLFSAHLDHLGLGTPVNGDRIYNGAVDNALGVAVMLESARVLAALPTRPKRSVVFIALTAEEKGLLGAQWYALRPTVPVQSLVANVNLDMPMLLTPTADVVPIGLQHSSLQAVVQQAARDLGVTLSPDPFPEESIFVRSDQYAFIRAGIPAVYLMGGTDSSAFGADAGAAMKTYLRDRYHQPGDDADQPIQYRDAARLARLNARIGHLVGDDAARPHWNAGDYFGSRFGPGLRPEGTRRAP